MKRGVMIALYAIGGLGVAMALSFATFALAGHGLSEPADQIRPVGPGNEAAAQASNPGGSPSAGHHKHQTSAPSPAVAASGDQTDVGTSTDSTSTSPTGSGPDRSGGSSSSDSPKGGDPSVTSPSPSPEPGGGDDHGGDDHGGDDHSGDGGGGDD